jgi:hypothetical protein
MTYLELVNSVLRRMRESTVASVNENAYSALIGEFVNDAKRVVEDAWTWRSLLDTVTIPLISGTATYNLNAYNTAATAAPLSDRSRLVVSPTTGTQLLRVIDTSVTPNVAYPAEVVNYDYAIVDRFNASASNTEGRPSTFLMGTTIRSAWVAGQTTARIEPLVTPQDSNYSLVLYMCNPQDRLASNTTVLAVPHDPVIQLAYTFCLYERDEELGEGLSLTSAKATSALADAVAFDQSTFFPELIFGAGL